MISFQVGDQVTVDGLPASEWRGVSGVIVRIVVREVQDGEAAQECAVQFPTGRRWFLAKHLTRSAPEKWVRLFRYEVLERWTDLCPDDVAVLNGDRDQLVALLQERCGFCLRRAGVEADSFLSEFQQRIHIARELPTDDNSSQRSEIDAA